MLRSLRRALAAVAIAASTLAAGPALTRLPPGANAPAAAGLSFAVEALQTGRYLRAAEVAQRLLERDPDDADARAALGAARARTGAYTDALRAVGQGEAAAALRLGRIWAAADEGEELLALLGATDDLREAGVLDGATELAWRAISLRPRSPVAWAALAEVELAAGDLEGADFALWTSDSYGGARTRGPDLHARLALADGDPWAAEAVIRAEAGARLTSWTLAVRLSEALRAQGLPEEGEALLDAPRWVPQVRRPELRVERLALAGALGRRHEASGLCRDLAREYPGSATVQAAVRAWEHQAGVPCWTRARSGR